MYKNIHVFFEEYMLENTSRLFKPLCVKFDMLSCFEETSKMYMYLHIISSHPDGAEILPYEKQGPVYLA